jgi:hypothetical protein
MSPDTSVAKDSRSTVLSNEPCARTKMGWKTITFQRRVVHGHGRRWRIAHRHPTALKPDLFLSFSQLGPGHKGAVDGGGWERGSQQPNQIHLRPDGQRQPTTIGPCDFVIVQTLTGVGLMSWRCRRADPMKPADRGGWSGGRRGSTGRLEMDGDTHLARQALWRLSWPWLID